MRGIDLHTSLDIRWPAVTRDFELIRPPLDSTGCLSASTPCRRCAYNLMSQALDGRCPECGLPVAESTDANLWRGRSAIWIDHVLNGLWLWLIAVATGLLMVILVAVTASVTGGSSGAVLVPFLLCLLFLNIAGARSAGRSPLGRAYRDRLSRFLPLVAWVNAVAVLGQLPLAIYPYAYSGRAVGVFGAAWELRALLLHLVTALSTGGLILGVLAHVHRVAGRTARGKLRRSVLFPVFLTVVGTLIVAVANLPPLQRGMLTGVVIAFGGLLSFLAWALLLVPLIITMRAVGAERRIGEEWLRAGRISGEKEGDGRAGTPAFRATS